jgi:hypothetical protein
MADTGGLNTLVANPEARPQPRLSAVERESAERQRDRARREQGMQMLEADAPEKSFGETLSGVWEGMPLYDKLALGTAPIPVVGDVVGGVADLISLAKEPSWTNLGFLGAGLLPWVPSGTVSRTVKKFMNQPRTDTGSIVKAATNAQNFIPNYYAPGVTGAGKGLAYLRTIPKVAKNVVKSRYNPTDRAIQKEYNLSVTDRKVAQDALRISQEETDILEPIKEQIKAMKKDRSAFTGEKRTVTETIDGVKVKKVVDVETEDFKKLNEDARASRSRANHAGKKAIAQMNQSRSITKQRLGPDSGLEGLIQNINRVDHVQTFKSFNRGEGDYFEKVGDLIPTEIGRAGVDQIFKAIKTLPAIGYNPKKNYQMNIRRVHTGSAGELDQGMNARLYSSVDKNGKVTGETVSLTDIKNKIFLETPDLTKAQQKQKTYLRKSLGEKIGDRAFEKYMKENPSPKKIVRIETTKDFLKKLKENNIHVLNEREMLKGIKEGRDVPAVITGSAKTDAYELGGANYMTAINKDGKAITIVNDEHDLGKFKLPLADRYMNVSEPIVTDLTGKKITTKKQAKKKAELTAEKDIATENAIKKYEEIDGVKVRELNAKGKYEYLPLPAGFKRHEQWARTQAVAKVRPSHKDYSRLSKEVGQFAPMRVAKPLVKEEDKKAGGSVIQRNPYDYPPRAI